MTTCVKCGREYRPLRRQMCHACYENIRHRQTAYGRWQPDRVDAEPVRAHVQALQAAGVSLRRLPQLAGVDRSTIGTLVYGKPGRLPATWVTRRTADRILAVPIPNDPTMVAADGALVPAVGAQRRLRALVAAGWTMTYLGDQIGVTPQNFSKLIHQLTHITAARHRAICELFDRLQLETGPSARAVAYARRRRWPLPMQWDEDTIDDPDAPTPPAILRREPYARRAVAS